MTEKFINNIKGTLGNKTHIHHLHILGEIIGYPHSCCNFKLRKNKTKISAMAHNFFRFDFFFLWKGLRAGAWRTRNISIGDKNATNICFANIGNQVVFIDTIKYFLQVLGTLASNMTDNKKLAIKKECEKLIQKDEDLSKNFHICSKEVQEWVLNYSSTGDNSL